ncbi:hypothetical protein [Streptomyces nigrescens]|uniref:hypothetical protein n=1 Tax=Streptomyces nigrescens TaxID=1920 RepID=UPI002257AEAD|nr:hypothetical protein [Streptomyces libani]MCX5449526.1 hypothetical protein [Streptomyces libani]
MAFEQERQSLEHLRLCGELLALLRSCTACRAVVVLAQEDRKIRVSSSPELARSRTAPSVAPSMK